MSLKIVFEGSRTVCYDNGEFVGECLLICCKSDEK